MTAQLTGLVGANTLAGLFLVLGRVSPMFVLAPMFSSKMLPARARGVAAVAIAIGLTPLALSRHERIPLDLFSLGGLMLKELLVGLAFSFALGALFAAIQTAGSFLDTIIGFSFSSAVDPVTGVQSSLLVQLYGMIAVMVFIAIGGDAWLIQGLARTYDLVPLVAFPDLGDLVGGALHAFVQIFASALEVAAPVMLALVATDAALGICARVMPQLNVFAVGFPAKIAVGMLVIAASLPFAGGWIGDQVQQSVVTALDSLRIA